MTSSSPPPGGRGGDPAPFGRGEGGHPIGMTCMPGDLRSRGLFSAYDNILEAGPSMILHLPRARARFEKDGSYLDYQKRLPSFSPSWPRKYLWRSHRQY
jgi:hypothetical protein